MATDWTLQFNGITLGGATNPYQISAITGLHENPEIRSSDVARARTHGQFAGIDYLGGRDIAAAIEVRSPHPSNNIWQAFSQALVAGQTAEGLLVIQVPGLAAGATVQVNARVRRLALPMDRSYSLGVGMANVEWHCTDPRIYDNSLTSLSITQATGSGSGLTLPITFPITFGSGTSGGQATATNAGEFAAPWTATINGPVVNPRIENITAGLTLSFVGSLASGESLVVSSVDRSVLLNGTASRYSWLTSTSQWFDLAPGDSAIRFAGTSGSGSMTFNFRSVWI
jgi:hypothetical protein